MKSGGRIFWVDRIIEIEPERSRPLDFVSKWKRVRTANIWFASELQRRYGDRLLSLSVHPGVIQTDLARHLPASVVEGMREGFGKAGIAVKNVPQGAATSVWAATAAELAEHGIDFEPELLAIDLNDPFGGAAAAASGSASSATAM